MTVTPVIRFLDENCEKIEIFFIFDNERSECWNPNEESDSRETEMRK